MAARRFGAILIGLGAAFTGAAACGGGSNNTTATSGAGGSPMTTVSSTHATTGVSTGVGGGSMSGNLGNSCAGDSDCGGKLVCILPTATDPVFHGGPAGGYCSMSCKTDNDCPGASSACVTGTGGAGLCALTCTIGPVLMYLNDALDPNKCWGRNDLRCAQVNTATTACLPTCGKDSQCPMGRVCDPRLAVCVDTPNTGLPAGTHCDPNATTPQCAGVCVSFGGNDSACSEPCVLGGDPMNPVNTPNCGGPKAGLCVYSPKGNGAGDFGFCSLACKQQDECQNPLLFCLAVGGLTGKGVDNGFCLGTTACPNGASDCTPQMGTTCTVTKDGPFCLPAAFPLGNEAPDGGTDGGGADGGADDGGADGGADDGGADSGADDGGADGGADDGGLDAGGLDAGGLDAGGLDAGLDAGDGG